MGNVSRDENHKKEQQKYARDEKHCKRNEECHWWSY